MKFQLTSDWCVSRAGLWSIPSGTFLTCGDDGKWKALLPMTDALAVPQWTAIEVPEPLPFNGVIALDQEALDALIKWVPDHCRHLLQYSPGLRVPPPTLWPARSLDGPAPAPAPGKGRFVLMTPWPAAGGNRSLDTGTIIDTSEPQWAGVVMPLNAKALDVEAANALVEWHPFNQHLLHFAAGIKPTRIINV